MIHNYYSKTNFYKASASRISYIQNIVNQYKKSKKNDHIILLTNIFKSIHTSTKKHSAILSTTKRWVSVSRQPIQTYLPSEKSRTSEILCKHLSDPKPGHTTGETVRGWTARRRGGAGAGRTGRRQVGSPRTQSPLFVPQCIVDNCPYCTLDSTKQRNPTFRPQNPDILRAGQGGAAHGGATERCGIG